MADVFFSKEYSAKLMNCKVLLSIKSAKALLDRIRLNCYSLAAVIHYVVYRNRPLPDRLCSIQSKDHGVAVVVVPGSASVPKRQLLEALQRQIAALAGNSHVRGIILTGPAEGFGRCSQERSPGRSEAAEPLPDSASRSCSVWRKSANPALRRLPASVPGWGWNWRWPVILLSRPRLRPSGSRPSQRG